MIAHGRLLPNDGYQYIRPRPLELFQALSFAAESELTVPISGSEGVSTMYRRAGPIWRSKFVDLEKSQTL